MILDTVKIYDDNYLAFAIFKNMPMTYNNSKYVEIQKQEGEGSGSEGAFFPAA